MITVILGLLDAINYLSVNFFVKVILMVGLIPFPIMMERIVDYLSKNFYRECSRMYENVTILMKIEDELPQRRDLSDNRNFKGETDYIPNEWKKIKYPNTKAFVDAMMDDKKKDKFYSNLKPIFSILRFVSYYVAVNNYRYHRHRHSRRFFSGYWTADQSFKSE